MTPEDVTSEIMVMRERANRLALNTESLVAQKTALRLSRILKWTFNEFHDGANYTVGEYRFWFKIVKDGAVKAGYQHNVPVAGTDRFVPWNTPYPDFKNIGSLSEIDSLFSFMNKEYK